MSRHCWKCGVEVDKCMGFVNCGVFVKFINKEIKFEDIRELCGKCVLKESGILKIGELMDRTDYEKLVDLLKVLSKDQSRNVLNNCLRDIELILRKSVIIYFDKEINDKETRDKVTEMIKELFDSIKLKKHKLKTIVVCNSLNNPPDIINKKGLIVQIAIEIDDKLYTLKVKNRDDI